METLRQQLSDLISNKLWDSAELVGTFALSATGPGALSTPDRAETLILLADALAGSKHYRRALSHYRHALQLCRMNKEPVASLDEGSVKFKMAECYVALRELRSALGELETITARGRPLHTTMLLARLYREMGYTRAAVASYKEALRICPYAAEAAVALAELGAAYGELEQLLQGGEAAGGGGAPWLGQLTEAHALAAEHDYAGAIAGAGVLAQTYPDNLHVTVHAARWESARGRSTEAVQLLQRARAIDVHSVRGMDEYARLVGQRGDAGELNRITHELFAIDAQRPECWVAAALYWESKGDLSRALSYCDKGLQLDDRHVELHLLKGHLAVSLNRLDAATSAYRKAQTLRRDLRSFQGLVKVYLAAHKSKEALSMARDAVKMLPISARAHALLGEVYARMGEGGRARKVYESALQLDPFCLDAALSLVTLHTEEGRLDAAASLLQHHLNFEATEVLHSKMGGVMVAGKKYGEALRHYQAALAINAHSQVARVGLERVEKLLKGIDPDAVEEEEEDAPEGEEEESDFI